jgi:hypothetical protein
VQSQFLKKGVFMKFLAILSILSFSLNAQILSKEASPKPMLLEEFLKKEKLDTALMSSNKDNTIEGRLILDLFHVSEHGNWHRHDSGFVWQSSPSMSKPIGFMKFFIFKKKRYPFDNIEIYKKTFKLPTLLEGNQANAKMAPFLEVYKTRLIFNPMPDIEDGFRITSGSGNIVFTKDYVYFVTGKFATEMFGETYLKYLWRYSVFENEAQSIPVHDRLFDLSTKEKRKVFSVFIGDTSRYGSINREKINGKEVKYDIKGMYKKYLELEARYLRNQAKKKQ